MFNNKIYLYINSKFEMKLLGKYNGDIIEKLKNKQITILLETPEILIKKFTLPFCNRNKLYNVVYNELLYELGNLDNIIFDYKICNVNDKKMNLLVYCIKFSDDNNLKDIVCHNSINKIYILPLLIIKHIEIKPKDYILFYYENYITYMMEFRNDTLISFHTNSFCKINVIDEYINFINNGKQNDNINNIYFVNFVNKEIIMKLIKNYICYDMGLININDILNSETNSRRAKWKI